MLNTLLIINRLLPLVPISYQAHQQFNYLLSSIIILQPISGLLKFTSKTQRRLGKTCLWLTCLPF